MRGGQDGRRRDGGTAEAPNTCNKSKLMPRISNRIRRGKLQDHLDVGLLPEWSGINSIARARDEDDECAALGPVPVNDGRRNPEHASP